MKRKHLIEHKIVSELKESNISEPGGRQSGRRLCRPRGLVFEDSGATGLLQHDGRFGQGLVQPVLGHLRPFRYKKIKAL